MKYSFIKVYCSLFLLIHDYFSTANTLIDESCNVERCNTRSEYPPSFTCDLVTSSQSSSTPHNPFPQDRLRHL